eukprot:1009417-Pyramimonas_sp.AAC.1
MTTSLPLICLPSGNDSGNQLSSPPVGEAISILATGSDQDPDGIPRRPLSDSNESPRGLQHEPCNIPLDSKQLMI